MTVESIFDACALNDADTLRAHLPTSRDDAHTAMCLALAAPGPPACVRVLLDAGMHPMTYAMPDDDASDLHYVPALTQAVLTGHMAAVPVLLADARTDATHDDFAAFSVANANNDAKILEALMRWLWQRHGPVVTHDVAQTLLDVNASHDATDLQVAAPDCADVLRTWLPVAQRARRPPDRFAPC